MEQLNLTAPFGYPIDAFLPHTPLTPSSECMRPQDMTVLHRSALSPTSSPSQEAPSVASSVSSAANPKKKRKSWGQVLPEPTTNLPPRKRAKTEAEKAQRKYERVQRNRQAAHASRMRKQEEMEALQQENTKLKQQHDDDQSVIARLEQELKILRGTPSPPHDFPMSPALSSADPVPSLSSASPYSLASNDFDTDFIAPPPSQGYPYTSDLLQSLDASHSAAMCSRLWTSSLRESQMIKPMLRQQLRIRT